jgi:hypothetical protein
MAKPTMFIANMPITATPRITSSVWILEGCDCVLKGS